VPKKFKDVQEENVAPETATMVSGAKNAPRARRITKKAARKTPARKKPRRAKAASSAPSPATAPPSEQEIRLRAYFIAERRTRHSLPGDNHSDWLEARRQLFAEAGIPLD
jgi:hypothetical protein